MTDLPTRHIALCKWEEMIGETLLAAGATLHVIADAFDVAHGSVPPDLPGIASLYTVDTFDSIDALSGIAVDLRLRGIHVNDVVSFTEFSQYGAGLLRALLSAESRPLREAVLSRDKRAMKDCVRLQGVPVARSISLGGRRTPLSAPEIESSVGLPCVVKPAAGMGTLSTVVCRTTEELERALASYSHVADIHGEQRVAEEFLPGDEYHVDAVWHDSSPLVFVVSRYIVPRVAVVAAGVDDGGWVISEADAPDLHETLRGLHDPINAGLGITRGATHAEFIAGADGTLRFSEIATRFGGGPLIAVVSASAGVDIRSLFAREILTVPADEVTGAAPVEFPYSHVGWINLAPATSGIVGSLKWVDELRSLPFVYDATIVRGEGTPIEINHPSLWVVLVTVGASSAAELRDRLEQLRHDFPVPLTSDDPSGGVAP